LLESLGRLSKKAGVLATIALDRTSGAILTTTGSISPSHTSIVTNASPAVNASSSTSDEVASGSGDIGGVHQLASLVWNFVNASAGLVQGLDAEVTILSCGIIIVRSNMEY
jgi:dynein light chain roadblock-type